MRSSSARRSKGRFVRSRGGGWRFGVGYGLSLLRADAERVRRDLHVLVATPGDVDDHVLPGAQLSGHFLGIVERVGRLQRRDDAFQPGAPLERFERLFVGDARVLGQALIFQKGVLRPCGRVVQACGDGVGFADLSSFRLQHVAHRAVQDAELSFRQRRAVLARGEPPAGCLDADEPYTLAADEGVERADRVRASADAGDDGVGIRAKPLATLVLYLRPYNGLEVAHDPGVRRGPDDAPDDVVGVLDVGDPIPYGLVHGVLERPRAGEDGHDFGPEKLHPYDVEPLAIRVFLAHVDDTFLAVQGGDRCGGDAVLASAGLGDDALLAHAIGEQDLAQGVVDLVRPRVRQILALEPDVGPAPFAGKAPGEHEGGRAADEVPRQSVPLLSELGVVLVAFVGLFEFFQRVDQGFRDVATPEGTEVPRLSLLPQGRTSAPTRRFFCPARPPGNSKRPPRRARRTRPLRARSPGRAPRRRRCYHVLSETSPPPSRTARPCPPSPSHCTRRAGTGQPRIRRALLE